MWSPWRPFAVAFGLLTLAGPTDLAPTRDAVPRNHPGIGGIVVEIALSLLAGSVGRFMPESTASG